MGTPAQDAQVCTLGTFVRWRKRGCDRLSDEVLHKVTDRTPRAPAQCFQRLVDLITQVKIQTPWQLGWIQLPGVD